MLGDGTILWPGPHGHVFALSPRGHLLWSISVSGAALTPVVDEPHHLLVVATSSGTLSGYRLDGTHTRPTRLWSHSLAKVSFGNPALASDGTTYETAGDSLYAVAQNGRILWQVTTAKAVEVSAAVATDGTIVFGSNDQEMFGVAPDGAILWHHPIGNLSYSSPLTLSGDRVIYGDSSGDMATLNAHSGHLVRTLHGNGSLWTAAAVDNRGDAYFATRTGVIYGFGASGTQLFALRTTTKFDSYPAIAGDGTLLVGGDDGMLRAIGG